MKIIPALNRIEEYILSLMVLQMGLSIFLQVVMRYLFHSAVTWLDELVHIEVIVLTFFGAGLGIKHGSHICVDALRGSVKEPWGRILDIISHLVIAAYVAVIIYFGSHLIGLMSARPHFTPTLRIPKHYLYVMVCVGLGLMGIRSLARCWRILKELRSPLTNEDSS